MKPQSNSTSCCAQPESKPDCIKAALHRSLSCRLGLVNPHKTPHEAYVLPMIFVYEYLEKERGFNIYLHLQKPSPKNEKKPSLKKDCIDYHTSEGINVCFETDVVGPFIPSAGEVAGDRCYWTLAYASVIGHGRISKIIDKPEDQDKHRIRALNFLRKRYTGEDCPSMTTDPYFQQNLSFVDVWKIFLPLDQTTAKYHHLEFPAQRH